MSTASKGAFLRKFPRNSRIWRKKASRSVYKRQKGGNKEEEGGRRRMKKEHGERREVG